jgi:hypothetical protein
MAAMSANIREGQREPLTFTNAPTYEADGVTYVDEDAAIELGERIAERYETLLARLANE